MLEEFENPIRSKKVRGCDNNDVSRALENKRIEGNCGKYHSQQGSVKLHPHIKSSGVARGD